MRDPKRIQTILKHIESLWVEYPDLRFFQLVSSLQSEYVQQHGGKGKVTAEDENGYLKVGYDLFYVEDDAFIAFLEEKLGKRNSTNTNRQQLIRS